MAQALQPDNYVQFDINEVRDEIIRCYMHTRNRCCSVILSGPDYRSLVRDGFFRDGKSIAYYAENTAGV